MLTLWQKRKRKKNERRKRKKKNERRKRKKTCKNENVNKKRPERFHLKLRPFTCALTLLLASAWDGAAQVPVVCR